MTLCHVDRVVKVGAEDAVLLQYLLGTDSGGRAVPPAVNGWKQRDFTADSLYVRVP